MKGQLIDIKVQSETDQTLFYHVTARIVEVNENTLKIRYLEETKKMFEKAVVYKFGNEIFEVEKECVDEYYDTKYPEDVGFEKIEGVGYILAEDGECYDPSESESESDISSLDEDLIDL
jgi:hypothetical protein